MSDESVILINLLKVKPGKQDALIALLKQNTDTVVRKLPGWKTTRLIAAKDGPACRKDRKIRRRGLSDVGNQSSFCPSPRRLAQPFGVGQSYSNTQRQRLRGVDPRPSRRRGECDSTNVA